MREINVIKIKYSGLVLFIAKKVIACISLYFLISLRKKKLNEKCHAVAESH